MSASLPLPPQCELWVNADRTVLVRRWPDSDQVEVALRETPDHTWGPPIYCGEERT